MKKLFVKTVEFLTGAKVHATHTAIKGKKATGKEDLGTFFKNWRTIDKGDTSLHEPA